MLSNDEIILLEDLLSHMIMRVFLLKDIHVK
jgi:hypothetical protein